MSLPSVQSSPNHTEILSISSLALSPNHELQAIISPTLFKFLDPKASIFPDKNKYLYHVSKNEIVPFFKTIRKLNKTYEVSIPDNFCAIIRCLLDKKIIRFDQFEGFSEIGHKTAHKVEPVAQKTLVPKNFSETVALVKSKHLILNDGSEAVIKFLSTPLFIEKIKNFSTHFSKEDALLKSPNPNETLSLFVLPKELLHTYHTIYKELSEKDPYNIVNRKKEDYESYDKLIQSFIDKGFEPRLAFFLFNTNTKSVSTLYESTIRDFENHMQETSATKYEQVAVSAQVAAEVSFAARDLLKSNRISSTLEKTYASNNINQVSNEKYYIFNLSYEENTLKISFSQDFVALLKAHGYVAFKKNIYEYSFDPSSAFNLFRAIKLLQSQHFSVGVPTDEFQHVLEGLLNEGHLSFFEYKDLLNIKTLNPPICTPLHSNDPYFQTSAVIPPYPSPYASLFEEKQPYPFLSSTIEIVTDEGSVFFARSGLKHNVQFKLSLNNECIVFTYRKDLLDILCREGLKEYEFDNRSENLVLKLKYIDKFLKAVMILKKCGTWLDIPAFQLNQFINHLENSNLKIEILNDLKRQLS